MARPAAGGTVLRGGPAASLSVPGPSAALYALSAATLRSLRIYIRYRFDAVMQMFNAVVWLAPLYFLGQAFAVDGRVPGLAALTGSADYTSFLMLGWVLAGFVYVAFWGVGFALWHEMFTGTLEANWLSPSPRWILIVAPSLRMLITTIISSAMVIGASSLFLGARFSGDVLRAALLLIPALLALYGVGFIVAGFVLVFKEPGSAIDLSSYLINVVSGDRFPVTALPRPLFILALAIPLTYAFDALRHAMLGTTSLLPYWTELAILCAFAVVVVPLGYWIFLRADRRVRRLGTLAQH